MSHESTSAPAFAPAQWDTWINLTADPGTLAETLTGAPPHIKARRAVHFAMTLRDAAAIDAALEELDRHNDQPVCGIRLMALVSRGLYGQVLSTSAVELSSLDPFVVENACDAAFARGMALAEAGDFHGAQAQLLLALRLAQACGMAYRVQHVEMEIGRVRTSMGDPQPQVIIDAMNRLPLSSRRRRWGQRILAEALMSLGDYRAAHAHLVQDCDLAHFTAALLGVDESSRCECPTDRPYTSITAGLWALRRQEAFTAPAVSSSSPQGEYGQLLRAWAMLRTRSMAGQARNLLLGLDARTPDHRAHRSAALIQANALAPAGEDIDLLIHEFNAALRAMSTPDQFLRLLRSIHPECYVLLGMFPGIHAMVAETLPDIPILTGAGISYRFQTHRLPGRANGSPIMVSAAALGRTGPEARPHPQAAQRIREALAALDARAYVNLGVVFRQVVVFRDGTRLARRAKWDAAVERVLSWIDSPGLQSELREGARL